MDQDTRPKETHPWIDAASRRHLASDSLLEVEAGGVAILLYDVAGRVYATAAICPHHAAWLSQGTVRGDVVDCPRHMGQFHIPTGRKLRGPECPDLRAYPVHVQDGRIWVQI